jgi:hypothetical protein
MSSDKVTDKKSLQVRLREACVGHPSAYIPWPHRILHEAASAIEMLRRCILAMGTAHGELRAQLAEAERERDSANFDKSRLLDERQVFLKGMDELRAQLAEARTNCTNKSQLLTELGE